MGKWLMLGLISLCWAAVGFSVFGGQQAPVLDRTSGRTERIIAMAPNLTEILFALGLGARVAAVTNDSDYPAEVCDKPRVGTFWQPSLEAVIAARPDLVITLGFTQQKELARRLNRMGYRALTVNIEKLSDFFEAVEKIGIATNSKAKAEELTTRIKTSLQQLRRMVSQDTAVKVLYVVQREPLRVAGRDTFINEIVELAGGQNAIGPTIQKYPPIGAEQVLASGAEVIIETAMRGGLESQRSSAVEYWSRFDNLPAVRDGRIYVLEADTVCRLGPRIYQGIENIAKCLRPALFEKVP